MNVLCATGVIILESRNGNNETTVRIAWYVKKIKKNNSWPIAEHSYTRIVSVYTNLCVEHMYNMYGGVKRVLVV